jgi:hypothetical protein
MQGPARIVWADLTLLSRLAGGAKAALIALVLAQASGGSTTRG